MTPIFCCGAECRGAFASAGVSPHWDASSGTAITVDTTTYRNVLGGGAAAFLIDTTAAAASSYLQYRTLAAGTRILVARFYIRVDTAVSVRQGVFVATGNNGMRIGLNTTGVLYAQATTGTTVDATANITGDGIWHRVDLMFDRSGATATVSWAIDGVAQTPATIAVAAADMSAVRFGLDGTATAKFRLDDLAMASGASGDYPIGDGRVLSHVPIACGTHSFTAGNFQDDTSTNLVVGETTSWAKLDEQPVVTTDHIKQVVSNASGYVEYQMESSKGGSSPRAVEVIIAQHNLGTQANTQKGVLWDGTTAADIYALSSTSLTTGQIRMQSGQFAKNPSNVAWTEALFNALRVRWGYSNDVLTVPALDAIIIEAEYAPAVAPAAGARSFAAIY